MWHWLSSVIWRIHPYYYYLGLKVYFDALWTLMHFDTLMMCTFLADGNSEIGGSLVEFPLWWKLWNCEEGDWVFDWIFEFMKRGDWISLYFLANWLNFWIYEEGIWIWLNLIEFFNWSDGGLIEFNWILIKGCYREFYHIPIHVTHWIDPFWFYHLIPNFLLGKWHQKLDHYHTFINQFCPITRFYFPKIVGNWLIRGHWSGAIDWSLNLGASLNWGFERKGYFLARSCSLGIVLDWSDAPMCTNDDNMPFHSSLKLYNFMGSLSIEGGLSFCSGGRFISNIIKALSVSVHWPYVY